MQGMNSRALPPISYSLRRCAPRRPAAGEVNAGIYALNGGSEAAELSCPLPANTQFTCR